MKKLLPACLFLTAAANAASADGNWIVGLLVEAEQNPYVGAEDSALLIPYLAYETERLHIGLDEISYELIGNGQFSVEVFIDPRFAPDLPGTALFAGLDRDDAFEAGFDARLDFGAAYASLSLQGDVSGVHDGFEGKAEIGYQTEVGQLVLGASAGVLARDANLNNHLFGVSADEATASRAAFEMDNTVNAFAEVSAILPLSDNAFLIGEVSYHDLGEAQDSPLVDRSSSTSIVLGVGFQF